MYISTMRKYIQAMGGELEIIAKFPDGNVKVDKFEGLEAKLWSAPCPLSLCLRCRLAGADHQVCVRGDGVQQLVEFFHCGG